MTEWWAESIGIYDAAGAASRLSALSGVLTALKQAGCKRLYEKVSGATRDRPALTRMLDQLREGDVVVVAWLDRLARSTRDLLEIAEILKEDGTGLRSGIWQAGRAPL